MASEKDASAPVQSSRLVPVMLNTRVIAIILSYVLEDALLDSQTAALLESAIGLT